MEYGDFFTYRFLVAQLVKNVTCLLFYPRNVEATVMNTAGTIPAVMELLC